MRELIEVKTYLEKELIEAKIYLEKEGNYFILPVLYESFNPEKEPEILNAVGVFVLSNGKFAPIVLNRFYPLKALGLFSDDKKCFYLEGKTLLPLPRIEGEYTEKPEVLREKLEVYIKDINLSLDLSLENRDEINIIDFLLLDDDHRLYGLDTEIKMNIVELHNILYLQKLKYDVVELSKKHVYTFPLKNTND